MVHACLPSLNGISIGVSTEKEKEGYGGKDLHKRKEMKE